MTKIALSSSIVDERFSISREISIDAGHRVTNHGSKCRHLHGHRYTIQAWCEGHLFEDGEQQGMVLDFGFLKEEMMREIDAHFDHGFMFWMHDSLCWEALRNDTPDFEASVYREIEEQGAYFGHGRGGTKICVLSFVPTAENLAHFWYQRLKPRVAERTAHCATLAAVKVWETPNCWAVYGPGGNRIHQVDG